MILETTQSGIGKSTLPIILIHGMGSAATAWQLVMPQLAENNWVIAIDLPGHGKTALPPALPMSPKDLAKYVFDTMSALNIEQAHLVGNSLGGWTALEMAATEPKRVASVLALAPAGLWLAPFTARYPISSVARNFASTLKVVSPFGLKYEWGRKLGFGDVSPQWRNYSYQICLDATLALANSTGYYPAWDALLHKRFDEKISAAVPLVIIFGDSDRTLPAKSCQERSLIPTHAKWITWENCGHAPMWDYPDRVIDQIGELIQ